jgi:hypothetical protein
MDKPGLIKVKVSDLKHGPIQHETLPDDLLQMLKTLYDLVGHYNCPTLEEWELGFMRDMNPAREAAVWSHIALGWITYHQRYLGRMLPEGEESKLVTILTGLSMGVEQDTLASKFGKELVANLWESYANPNSE